MRVLLFKKGYLCVRTAAEHLQAHFALGIVGLARNVTKGSVLPNNATLTSAKLAFTVYTPSNASTELPDTFT